MDLKLKMKNRLETTTFENLFLPYKDDHKKHGMHGWFQPDQVHDRHIFHPNNDDILNHIFT
jgi:hypothetical protein